jgi:hypothetical protein
MQPYQSLAWLGSGFVAVQNFLKPEFSGRFMQK